jgi:hypothetical protein
MFITVRRRINHLRTLMRGRRSFTFNGRPYDYDLSWYNDTYNCERTVEVPVFRDLLARGTGGILEVGNVLGHYGIKGHAIVDKYERGRNVINKDILDYDPGERYGLVVSISTLEHIGFDDQIWTSEKEALPEELPNSVRALEKMMSLLAPGGRLWFSIPLGYNKFLEHELVHHQPRLALYYMARTNRYNDWSQVFEYNENAVYGQPFNNANYLLLGEYVQKTA